MGREKEGKGKEKEKERKLLNMSWMSALEYEKTHQTNSKFELNGKVTIEYKC